MLPSLTAWLQPRRPAPVPFAARRTAHLRLGRRGEQLAARLLRELGLDILCRNYRGPHGELDIVARDDGTLCFVEVKTLRRPHRPGRPGAKVGAAKRRNLVRTAKRYLHRLGHPAIPHRYDVVELVLDPATGHPQFAAHHPDAFREDELRLTPLDRFPAEPV